MKMEPIPRPDGEPVHVFANLWDGLSLMARINLTLAAVMVASAIATRSASLAAAGLATFEEGAVHSLLMAALRLRSAARVRLAATMVCLQLIPAGVFLWCLGSAVERQSSPPASWLALAGALSLVTALVDAVVPARFRHDRAPLLAAMTPSLRANVPIGVTLIASAIAIGWFPTAWIDVSLGAALASSRLRATRMLLQLGRFSLRDSIWTCTPVARLIEDHPRLAILRSWVWREAAGLPWAIRRMNPLGEPRTFGTGGLS